MLRSLREVPELIIADPPWKYSEAIGESIAADHYDGLEIADIVRHLHRRRKWKSIRLALWITWPILAADWPARLDGWGRATTGGAWLKSDEGDEGNGGHYGPGYHWAGCSEPVLIYTHGSPPCDRGVALRNAWHEAPGAHSRKPVEWMRQWLRRWTSPDGLVVDPYAGLGAVAQACMLEGRRYIGSEIDPVRHKQALGLLAQVRR
jgi:hypothetical protein